MADERVGRGAHERQREVEREPLDERVRRRVVGERVGRGRAAVDRARDLQMARVAGDRLGRDVAAGADDRLVALAVDHRAVQDRDVLPGPVADLADADVLDPPGVTERALEHRGGAVGIEQRAHRGHGRVRRRRRAAAALDEALLGGEPAERARDRDQLVGRALLGDPPALDHHDLVGRARERHRVRDEDRRAALHEGREAVHDLRLARGVEARRGLVEDEDRRVAQEHARDADALALAAREADALRAERAVEAVRQGGDEVLGVGRAHRPDDVLARHVTPVGDVLGDGAGEEHGVLQQDPDLVAQPVQRALARVAAVDEDLRRRSGRRSAR